jgi:hypothetical protein
MLKKLRTFLVALLLAPVLVMNAHAFTTDADGAVYTPPQQSSGWCYVYYMGRYWLMPC